MSNIHESFKPLKEAYVRQFGIELDGTAEGDIIVVSDGTKDGVSRVGSVKANWLKRNAPKHGFVRQGVGVTFSWNGAVTTVETAPAVEAETSELAALVTASSSVPDEPTVLLNDVIDPDEDADELLADTEGADELLADTADEPDDDDDDDIPEGWRSGQSNKEHS